MTREAVVLWRKKPNGVFVSVYVDDPQPDSAHNREKDACKRGHRFTEDNTIIRPDGRQCRACKNATRRAPTPEQKRRAAALKRMRRAEREPDIQVEYVECTDAELLAAGTRYI